MNILIIEESPTLSQLLIKTLEAYGHKTTLDTKELVNKGLIKSSVFDFVIINTGLDGDNTSKILTEARKSCSSIKVLGVCNKGSWVEKVEFLKRGGDDVLTYPFPMQELLARIDSLMRRPKNYTEESICLGSFVLDTDGQTVFKENEEIALRKKEYEVLEYLAKNKNRVVSRCELLDHVWDYRQYIGSNTVDVHIRRLRSKLKDSDVIQTIHGVGYQVKDKPKSS